MATTNRDYAYLSKKIDSFKSEVISYGCIRRNIQFYSHQLNTVIKNKRNCKC